MLAQHLSLGSLIGSFVLLQSVSAFADCYVDSQNGDDTKDAQSEANAVKTQAKIPSSCTVVRYKRGSLFNEAVKISNSAKTYGNYGNTSDPMPKFVVPHTANSGSLVSAFQGGVTIDGLYLEGSKGDGTMAGLIKGVCVMLGSNSKLLNSEVSVCDIGVMLSGTGSVVSGNNIHDLTMAVDGATSVDPNSVGGAEGIFINGSNNEVSYNTFANCSSAAAWTGGNCDGGATEVTVGSGATVSGVKVHHNYAYNTCGFFEVSSMAGSGNGTFADSEFYDNVAVDSGWLMLLQVNNTNLSNIQWENNTVVQHSGSSNSGMLTTVFTGTSSGVSGGSLAAGAVSMTNNLIILDGVSTFGDVINTNITSTTNLIIDTSKQEPGVKNVKGIAAADFDLVSGSPAIDKGTSIASITVDYLNRAVPDSSGTTDIGAFEFGATPSTSFGGAPTAFGGAPGLGGAALNTGATSADEAGGCGCRFAGTRDYRSIARLCLMGLMLVATRRRRRG